MNPYTLVRKTFSVLGYVLKALVILGTLFLTGIAGVSIFGSPWGWVLGPVGCLTFLIAIAAIRYALVHLPFWWHVKEREYTARQRTAHGEDNKVTN